MLMESDLARAFTHTLTSSRSEMVDRQLATSILAAGSVGHPGVLGTRLLFVVASGSVRLSPSSILVSKRQTRPQLRSQIEDQL